MYHTKSLDFCGVPLCPAIPKIIFYITVDQPDAFTVSYCIGNNFKREGPYGEFNINYDNLQTIITVTIKYYLKNKHTSQLNLHKKITIFLESLNYWLEQFNELQYLPKDNLV